jgi:uncharacterized membrane protein YagU involved in acid resistance
LGIAAAGLHFSFGAAVGAMYGALVWLVADEIVMPLIGLSRSTLQRPLELHLQSLAAHLVYGSTTEHVRQAISDREEPTPVPGIVARE